MWVRGLKLQVHTSKRGRRHVAPYVGAWIETCHVRRANTNIQSHPMWVRGLKLLPFSLWVVMLSRTLCGCVD